MRPAGEAKLGFYPLPPESAEALTTHLRLGSPPVDRRSSFVCLDPCAGEGGAIGLIARRIGIPDSSVYAIELDPDRAATIASRHPDFHLIGPASFLGSRVTAQSFGLVYLNPPFSSELGGGRREEESFLYAANRTLIMGGVLVLVCPFHVLHTPSLVATLDSFYEDIGIYRIPDTKNYKEVVAIIGRRRRDYLPKEKLHAFGCLHQLRFPGWAMKPEHFPEVGTIAPQRYDFGGAYDYGKVTPIGTQPGIRRWAIPPAWPPSTFVKVRLTDAEVLDAFGKSPLNRIFSTFTPAPALRPPLPLNNGHLGMMLASGMLDGDIMGPDGPHVVRGSSSKTEAKSESELIESDSGTKTKTVYSQTIVTTVRIVAESGQIYTHSNGQAIAEPDEDFDDE